MKFISITKPGIIFGNIVTVSGGFFLGSHGAIHFKLLLLTLLGMALVIASGCVFNNVIDRDIDHLMERTCDRVLVKGLVSPKTALFYGGLLGVLGFLFLYLTTNWIAVLAAAIGWFVYVVVYSLSLKRRSTFGTTLGGIAGALPPVVGYAAASGRFDLGALLLFLILFFWQMPHFYAISIYRLKDFQAAALPILPLKKSIPYTKTCMLIYVIAFMGVAVLPSILGYTGVLYGLTASSLGVIWILLGLKGLYTQDDRKWARQMFGFSILAITLLCLAMAL